MFHILYLWYLSQKKKTRERERFWICNVLCLKLSFRTETVRGAIRHSFWHFPTNHRIFFSMRFASFREIIEVKAGSAAAVWLISALLIAHMWLYFVTDVKLCKNSHLYVLFCFSSVIFFVFVALIYGFMFAAVVTLFLNSLYWEEGTPQNQLMFSINQIQL